MSESNSESIVLGGGCFWCIEAVYKRRDGIISAVSGYAGGAIPAPTYEQVCTGTTGHAEVVRVTFEPSVVSLREILDLFFRAHNPTTLNRQGADVGTQYRSVIFYEDEAQVPAIRDAIAEAQGDFDDPIVTEVQPAPTFYRAEDYHQDYFDRNPFAGYCRVVIRPKLQKLGMPTEGGLFLNR